MRRSVVAVGVMVGLALSSCSSGGDADAAGSEPTTSRTTSPAPTTSTSPALSESDQAFVDELRGIDGLTFAGTDAQFRLHSELMICASLRTHDGDWGEHIAGFRQYNPEISEEAVREFTAIAVDYLCPELRPPSPSSLS